MDACKYGTGFEVIASRCSCSPCTFFNRQGERVDVLMSGSGADIAACNLVLGIPGTGLYTDSRISALIYGGKKMIG